MEEKKISLSEIKLLLDETHIQAVEMLKRQIGKYNPVDLAEILEDLDDEEKVRLVEAMTPVNAAELIDETDQASREHVVTSIAPEMLAQIVDEMPPDEGADLVSELPAEQQKQLLDAVDEDHAEDLKELMSFEPDTAGGRMTTDFIQVPESSTVREALNVIKSSPDSEAVHDVYTVDAEGRLRGFVEVRDLLGRKPEEIISSFHQADPVSVGLHTDQEDVANTVSRYNVHSLPVVDERGCLRGVITVDDVIDVMDEEAAEDMYRIAGTASRDPSREKLLSKYVKRMPFLLTTFVGGLLTILIQYLFRFTTDQLLALTFFIPIINGLAGNVGTQSSTIMVRGFATGDIEVRDIYWLLPLEAGTGALIGVSLGLICGVLTALIAGHFEANPALGLVVGISMACGTTIAAVFGTLIPSFCERTGIDPAISAGPFIATLLDSTALSVYLSISTVFFHYIK